ncbi:MAG: hypothetical protein WCS14_05260 [Candidatus Methanomethylophilaceae archaeon]|jgi:hypothetical protein
MTSDDDSKEYEKQSRFWLNLPPLLFDTYQDLVRSYADMDTRAIYIRTFTELLSLTLPMEIEEYDEYKDALEESPLPDDPLMKISFDGYTHWLRTLRLIMRRAGIIGGERVAVATIDDLDDTAMIFDDLQVV